MRIGDGWGDDAYLARQPFFRDYPRLLVYETGVHFIDTFRFLLGEVDQVFAQLRRLNPVIRGEDTGQLVLRFTSGATAIWDANRYNEVEAESPRFTFGELRIDATRGHLTLDTDSTIRIKPLGQPGRDLDYPPDRHELRRRLRLLPAAALRRSACCRARSSSRTATTTSRPCGRRGGVRVGAAGTGDSPGRPRPGLRIYINECRLVDVRQASALYRLLGDEARLRLLRLLSVERLNVTELTAILGLAQSGVSRHLRLLKEAGFVDEQRDGGFTYYRLAPTPGEQGLGPLWDGAPGAVRRRPPSDPAVKADDARLQEVLRLRKENFRRTRRRHARQPAARARTQLGGLVARARPAAAAAAGRRPRLRRRLSHDRSVALGARSVVGVDRSPTVLARARGRWRNGAAPPTSRGSAASSRSCRSRTRASTWRCCRRRCTTRANPARAVAEAARIWSRAAACSILDLREHEEAWVRDKLGDRSARLQRARPRASCWRPPASSTSARPSAPARPATRSPCCSRSADATAAHCRLRVPRSAAGAPRRTLRTAE